MSTFIPPTPAANKPAEQHQEPSEQDSFDHLLYKVLRLTSEQVQDLNGWMKHRGIPNVHEIIAQNFRKPHALEDDLQFIREGKPCYIQSNVMISLSLMITYMKPLWYSAKTKYFGPFYYIQIDPQDYDEWRTTPPEEEVHFQTPSKLGSPATPRSMATSEASESYITLTNFKKGIKRDASAYPIFKNERYYNTFIHHFKATAKAQGLNSLMDPNFTPGSDEYEQQLFQEQQDFLYSVLISSLKTEFSEALVKDHEGDAQLILELLHEHHRGNSQYSRSEINRITKYLTNIKLDDTWRGTNENFLMHYNDQLRLLDSLVDSDEKLPDNTRVTFLESAVESVPDLRRVKITDNVLQAQLDSTRPISYRSYFDLLKDAAFHLDQATKRGNKIRRTNVHFSGPNDEDEHQNLSSDDNQVTHQEDVYSKPPEPLSYSLFQSHFQGSSTPNTQKIFLPKPIWEKLSKDQQQMIIDHNRSLPKSGSTHLSTPNKSPSPLPHKPTPQQTAKSQQVHTHQSDEGTTDTTKTETTPSDPLLAMVHQSIHTSDDDASDISNVLSVKRSRQIQVPSSIKDTFNVTTRHGTTRHTQDYIKKHFKSRSPVFNIPRRSEAVATDTILSDTPAVDDGSTMAQFFCGRDTLVCDAYGIKSTKQFINTLSDNIRKWGAMDTLISDGGKYEISQQVTDLLRSLFIQDYQSEPYHQHQNKAENHFGLAKRYTNTVMNTSGCPAFCCLLCLQYICVVLNHLASPTLQGICPVQALQGTTPDVSFMLHFSFYEPVYYRIDSSEPDLNFPSSSNEKKGYWVGFADNQGDSLTWRILTEDTHKIIIRSGVRSALRTTTNQRLASSSGEGTTLPFPIPYPQQSTNSLPLDPLDASTPNFEQFVTSQSGEDEDNPIPMANIDIPHLLGRSFLLPPEDNGERHMAKIIDIDDHGQPLEDIKFKLKINKDQAEEIMSYNQLMD